MQLAKEKLRGEEPQLNEGHFFRSFSRSLSLAWLALHFEAQAQRFRDPEEIHATSGTEIWDSRGNFPRHRSPRSIVAADDAKRERGRTDGRDDVGGLCK